MTDYNAKCLVTLEAPTDALQYAIDRTAREVADKTLGEIRNKECCIIRMVERLHDEPTMNSVVVHCRIDIDDVVLCKDCIYGQIEGKTTKFMVCEFHDDIATDPHNHCSWGERREP